MPEPLQDEPTIPTARTDARWRMTRRMGIVGALGALLSGCSPTRALDALVKTDTYVAQEGVAYGSDPRQRLDVYRPVATSTGAARSAGAPIVVFFYGGSWTRGERADYRFVGESLASAGVITVVCDYRLSPQVLYPVFLQDSALAARWVFDHLGELGADPARVFVMGHSAGGWNAAMLALDARWLSAAGAPGRRFAGWIGLAGAYDFLPIENPEAQVAFDWPGTPRDSQPIAHVSAAAPRALLMAPERDTLVNPERNTEGMAARLRAVGVPVKVLRPSGINHVTLVAAMAGPLRWLAPVRQEVLDFVGAPGAG